MKLQFSLPMPLYAMFAVCIYVRAGTLFGRSDLAMGLVVIGLAAGGIALFLVLRRAKKNPA
jgi:hypothetical protein